MSIFLTSLVGLGLTGLCHHDRPAGPAVSCCSTCEPQHAEVAALICTLQTSPRWRTRDNAAHDLRDFDWECHPEAVLALVHAMLTDCEEEVREEAAQSLAKMKPCLPEAHMALDRAAKCDPDWATRHWAKKALRSIGNRCEGTCNACGVPELAEPAFIPTIYPGPGAAAEFGPGLPYRGPSAYPGAVPMPGPSPYADPLPYAAPPEGIVPPAETILPDALPASPTLPSPFNPSAARDRDGKPEPKPEPKLAEKPRSLRSILPFGRR